MNVLGTSGWAGERARRDARNGRVDPQRYGFSQPVDGPVESAAMLAEPYMMAESGGWIAPRPNRVHSPMRRRNG